MAKMLSSDVIQSFLDANTHTHTEAIRKHNLHEPTGPGRGLHEKTLD